MALTDDQKSSVVKMLCDSIIESVQAAGSLGAPAGHLYAALMQHGFTLEQFERIMDALMRIGKVRKSGNLYFAV